MRYKLALVLLGLTAHAEAGLRQYSATIDKSSWSLVQNSPLLCELSHPIPHFGEAFFRSVAGKELNMQFELSMLRLPDHYALAEVLSVPPVWRPGEQAKAITSMKILKQFDGDLGKAESWIMLTELEQGYSPTFYFSDWYSPYDRVSVSLNPVHFMTAMDQFSLCVSSLLPYTFDDIAFTVLTYESGGDELTKASKKRLDQIAEYLKHDQSIESIDIQAYSDSFGGRWMNEQLSIKRAETIKARLISFGLEESRIRTEGLGEKRHVASNESSLGRAKNRRVVIQMEKP
ncbi:OmpA family protein [Rheinheimera sediminis]|uniref:flagellar protein MotY n=1 Tax=Rheinheimera sp. YQF-1 TaxID=2499626 RepID=UPI000FD896F0|nr:OmpA family protein [Rheinheimera sp. YQF-1]RVT46242.1 OmpA family protein [Rheinheimera sp. YQF-1]